MPGSFGALPPTAGLRTEARPTQVPRAQCLPHCRTPAPFPVPPRRATVGASVPADGLSQPKLEELFLWLQLEAIQGRPVHIMTVQETHWSFTSEWQSQGHWLIHSSLEKPTRSAGVLQILRQDFVGTQQVRTAHVIPGRLVHTRLATEPPISLITVYQHRRATNSAHTPPRTSSWRSGSSCGLSSPPCRQHCSASPTGDSGRLQHALHSTGGPAPPGPRSCQTGPERPDTEGPRAPAESLAGPLLGCGEQLWQGYRCRHVPLWVRSQDDQNPD